MIAVLYFVLCIIAYYMWLANRFWKKKLYLVQYLQSCIQMNSKIEKIIT